MIDSKYLAVFVENRRLYAMLKPSSINPHVSQMCGKVTNTNGYIPHIDVSFPLVPDLREKLHAGKGAGEQLLREIECPLLWPLSQATVIAAEYMGLERPAYRSGPLGVEVIWGDVHSEFDAPHALVLRWNHQDNCFGSANAAFWSSYARAVNMRWPTYLNIEIQVSESVL